MGATDLQMTFAAFELWINAEGEDNRADIKRLKRMLPIVLSECVTETQKKYIIHYFVDKLNTQEIAEMYGLNKSTVSRTIRRGLKRAYSYLRFTSPLFINTPQSRGYLSNR